jgi:hypothetical protein
VRILLAKLLVELCRILDRPMGIVVILIFLLMPARAWTLQRDSKLTGYVGC